MKLGKKKKEIIGNVVGVSLFILMWSMMLMIVLATSLTPRSNDITSPLYVVINDIEY